MSNRLKNYGLWVSVAAFLPILLSSFGIKIIPNYEAVVNGLLGILVLAGILNNPASENHGFLDDKPIDSSQDTNEQ